MGPRSCLEDVIEKNAPTPSTTTKTPVGTGRMSQEEQMVKLMDVL